MVGGSGEQGRIAHQVSDGPLHAEEPGHRRQQTGDIGQSVVRHRLHGRGADIEVLRVVGGAMKVGKQFFFEKKNQKTFSR
jgi:hypothetical protein